VRWEYRGTSPDATICNCTVCRRYGVLWAHENEGDGIRVDDPSGCTCSLYARLVLDFV
jgi:hypothetical protein